MSELNNELEIHASAERVWQLLTDFARFPQWNPYIHRTDGEPALGAQLRVTTQPSGGRRTIERATVLKVEQNHELRWVSRSLFPGVRDVEHVFTIEPLDPGRVRFTQREITSGLLASMQRPSRSTDVRRGFREMSQALKLEAERPRSGG
ncbi:MAG: hypothetical protein RLZZ387_4520 [Chloroflexota bacterium]|jgi:hypothetical protein